METVYSNNIKKVLISDDVNEKCVQILENNDLVVVKNTKLSVEQLKEEIKVTRIYSSWCRLVVISYLVLHNLRIYMHYE